MTAPAADPDLLTWAVELTKEAGRRTLSRFRADDLAIESKGDGTPVTEADKDAESYIRSELAVAHPGDAILGEEEGAAEGTSGRRWVIDPIDGTKAFMRGVPLYTGLTALEDEHGWLVSVINMPAIGECVYAGRGLGCFQDDRQGERRPARVGERSETPFMMASGYTRWDETALLNVKRAGWALRTWGDGFGYALVATGRADAMVDPAAALWDVAPMPLVIAEAGGRFTTIDGGELDTSDPLAASGVATNGERHEELLSLLVPGQPAA
ncbi:inositol monophosphatase family protein [Actinospongicola halichondriae]|uniref:inositol monophosphatase family protein n=1 Tax=Actinospongicola halichondriae TaxID=3236844 RepID=UPI003D5909E0